jgi:hypothetical protein
MSSKLGKELARVMGIEPTCAALPAGTIPYERQRFRV